MAIMGAVVFGPVPPETEEFPCVRNMLCANLPRLHRIALRPFRARISTDAHQWLALADTGDWQASEDGSTPPESCARDR